MMSGGVASLQRPPFVLVHGAFHGGWCWKGVAAALRAAGHEVFTPTQTGLGERRHLLSSAITMETFVQDILNVLICEELTDVVLVGHSFGARSVNGVADRARDLIRKLIYIDGGIEASGRSRLEAMPEAARAQRIAAAVEFDGGISVPAPPADRFGLSEPTAIAWVNRRMTPQPLGSERTGIALANPVGNGLPATYIHCIDPPFPVTAASAAYAERQPGWRFRQFKGGHDAIISHPQEIAAILLEEVM